MTEHVLSLCPLPAGWRVAFAWRDENGTVQIDTVPVACISLVKYDRGDDNSDPDYFYRPVFVAEGTWLDDDSDDYFELLGPGGEPDAALGISHVESAEQAREKRRLRFERLAAEGWKMDNGGYWRHPDRPLSYIRFTGR